MYKATLSSDERLKSRKRINYLFDEGKQLFSHPLKVYYLIDDSPRVDVVSLKLRFGITVPKSIYKKAVQRNHLKRKIREHYRKAKADFMLEHADIPKSVDWFFIYIDRKASEGQMEDAIKKLFSDLSKQLR